MHSYTIVGWTYSGGVHCNDCAAEQFGTESDVYNDSGRCLTGHGSYGHEIRPVFCDNLWAFQGRAICDDCQAEID